MGSHTDKLLQLNDSYERVPRPSAQQASPAVVVMKLSMSEDCMTQLILLITS